MEDRLRAQNCLIPSALLSTVPANLYIANNNNSVIRKVG